MALQPTMNHTEIPAGFGSAGARFAPCISWLCGWFCDPQEIIDISFDIWDEVISHLDQPYTGSELGNDLLYNHIARQDLGFRMALHNRYCKLRDHTIYSSNNSIWRPSNYNQWDRSDFSYWQWNGGRTSSYGRVVDPSEGAAPFRTGHRWNQVDPNVVLLLSFWQKRNFCFPNYWQTADGGSHYYNGSGSFSHSNIWCMKVDGGVTTVVPNWGNEDVCAAMVTIFAQSLTHIQQVWGGRLYGVGFDEEPWYAAGRSQDRTLVMNNYYSKFLMPLVNRLPSIQFFKAQEGNSNSDRLKIYDPTGKVGVTPICTGVFQYSNGDHAGKGQGHGKGEHNRLPTTYDYFRMGNTTNENACIPSNALNLQAGEARRISWAFNASRESSHACKWNVDVPRSGCLTAGGGSGEDCDNPFGDSTGDVIGSGDFNRTECTPWGAKPRHILWWTSAPANRSFQPGVNNKGGPVRASMMTCVWEHANWLGMDDWICQKPLWKSDLELMAKWCADNDMGIVAAPIGFDANQSTSVVAPSWNGNPGAQNLPRGSAITSVDLNNYADDGGGTNHQIVQISSAVTGLSLSGGVFSGTLDASEYNNGPFVFEFGQTTDEYPTAGSNTTITWTGYVESTDKVATPEIIDFAARPYGGFIERSRSGTRKHAELSFTTVTSADTIEVTYAPDSTTGATTVTDSSPTINSLGATSVFSVADIGSIYDNVNVIWSAVAKKSGLQDSDPTPDRNYFVAKPAVSTTTELGELAITTVASSTVTTLNDDNLNTVERFENYGDLPVDIVFSWTSVHSFGSVEMVCNEAYPTNLDIAVSNDGSTWSTVVNGFAQFEKGRSLIDLNAILGESVSGQYMRFRINERASAERDGRIPDLRIYEGIGTPATVEAPVLNVDELPDFVTAVKRPGSKAYLQYWDLRGAPLVSASFTGLPDGWQDDGGGLFSGFSSNSVAPVNTDVTIVTMDVTTAQGTVSTDFTISTQPQAPYPTFVIGEQPISKRVGFTFDVPSGFDDDDVVVTVNAGETPDLENDSWTNYRSPARPDSSGWVHAFIEKAGWGRSDIVSMFVAIRESQRITRVTRMGAAKNAAIGTARVGGWMKTSYPYGRRGGKKRRRRDDEIF